MTDTRGFTKFLFSHLFAYEASKPRKLIFTYSLFTKMILSFSLILFSHLFDILLLIRLLQCYII